jgi:AAA domain, putative AbiEii toxin, Type IV TA system
LAQQGDGIRSFVGTLLAAYCGSHRVLLIDEPEAFLHPPQARRLAALLAKSAIDTSRQVIVATHSADVVRGAIERSGPVVICRITRVGPYNHAAVLDTQRLNELYAKPILRSSTAVDGLFHKGAVVCEADADSRFYEAVALRTEQQQGLPSADLHFVHGGGKGQLPILARSYGSLKVPTAVVADIDILRDKRLFEDFVEAVGGDPTILEDRFNYVSTQLADSPPVLGIEDFVKSAQRVLNETSKERKLSPANRRELSQLLDEAAPWSEAKRYGITKLRGGAHEKALELLSKLKELGIFVVPVGELECWWRQGPANKAEWFPAAIRRIDEDQSSMPEAAAFMTEIRIWLRRGID